MNLLQAKFKSIQDCYNRQNLLTNLIFGSKAGLKGSQKETASVLSMSARYVETCLKTILAIEAKSQQPEYLVNEQIKNLYTCLAAHLGYLQEDHSNLVVSGHYSSKAQLIFKDLRRNTKVFPSSALETLKSAFYVG